MVICKTLENYNIDISIVDFSIPIDIESKTNRLVIFLDTNGTIKFAK